MHPLVPHGDAVADAGDAEHERMAAAGVDPFFDRPLQLTHPGVPGDQIGERRSETDEWALQGLFGYAGPFEQGTMRGTFEALGDGIAAFSCHDSFALLLVQ